MRKRNIPLRCRIVESVLTIEVGIDTLKYAAERLDDFWMPQTGKSGLVVSNADEFAREVVYALNDEGEDGSTPVSRLLDAAIRQAVECGCEGLDYNAMDAIEKAERVAVTEKGDQ